DTAWAAAIPAKAADWAILLHHAGGRCVGIAVAHHALNFHLDGARKVKNATGRGVALVCVLLFLRMVAEKLNDLDLPVFWTMFRIPWVQGGFLIHVVGITPLQDLERGNRPKIRHGLGMKLAGPQEWFEIGGRVVSNGLSTRHHQFGLTQNKI